MELNTNCNLKRIALNIKDLYVNITINKKTQVTKYFLHHYNTDKKKEHTLHTLHTILHQIISNLMKNFINYPEVLLSLPQYQF
jgi:hypothetical protein